LPGQGAGAHRAETKLGHGGAFQAGKTPVER
jgi:hypothetical protein